MLYDIKMNPRSEGAPRPCPEDDAVYVVSAVRKPQDDKGQCNARTVCYAIFRRRWLADECAFLVKDGADVLAYGKGRVRSLRRGFQTMAFTRALEGAGVTVRRKDGAPPGIMRGLNDKYVRELLRAVAARYRRDGEYLDIRRIDL